MLGVYYCKGKRRAGGRTAAEETRDDEDGLCHFCFAEGRGSAAAPVAAAAPVDSDVTRLPPRPAFRPAARRWGEMNAWEDAATSYLDQGLLQPQKKSPASAALFHLSNPLLSRRRRDDCVCLAPDFPPPPPPPSLRGVAPGDERRERGWERNTHLWRKTGVCVCGFSVLGEWLLGRAFRFFPSSVWTRRDAV